MQNSILQFLLVGIQCMSIINGNTDDIRVTVNEFNDAANALNFKRKVVLVTGSSSGIGATTARLFAKLGATVVVTGRNPDRIVQVVRDCSELSPYRLPLGIIADLTVPGNAALLINETIATFRKIDVLVNNAGIFDSATIQDPNYNQIFTKVRAINVDGKMELTRLAAPYIQCSRGTIIFIASLLAGNPRESIGPYGTSKSTVVNLAKVLANDLGPDVRVNVVSPGIVDGTHIFRNTDPSLRPTFLANSLKYTSRKRASIPLDIAKVIVFLASNLAESLDGQELHADQGAHIMA